MRTDCVGRSYRTAREADQAARNLAALLADQYEAGREIAANLDARAWPGPYTT